MPLQPGSCAELVQLLWNCAAPGCVPTVMRRAETDGRGHVSASLTIFSTASLGSHAIAGQGKTTGLFATTSFTVS